MALVIRQQAWIRRSLQYIPSSSRQQTLVEVKLIEHLFRVGELLQRGRYKSGPVPKVFKILPSHDQWARYLALTSPQNWSPQATLAATKIFVSNLKPEQTRVFLEGVVLPNVREDIKDNFGKLNVHLYDALKKGLYKPAAFFKGILFPLCKVSTSAWDISLHVLWLLKLRCREAVR